MLVINSNKKIVKVLLIYYLIKTHQDKIRTLFNSRNKVNTINLNYIQKLNFKIRKINIKIQIIDISI